MYCKATISLLLAFSFPCFFWLSNKNAFFLPIITQKQMCMDTAGVLMETLFIFNFNLINRKDKQYMQSEKRF